MRKYSWLTFLLGAAALLCLCGAENKVTPPKRLYYDERDLRYNPGWKSQEGYLEAELDDKPGLEVVINFIASYTPQSKTENEKKDPLEMTRRVIPIVQNYAFAQIYRQDAGGHYLLVKTINGMDRPQTLHLLTLDDKTPQALAIVSPGGENYSDLTVLRWQDGGYRTLLQEGTSGDVEILSPVNPVRIRIGAKTWQWDVVKKRFEIIN